MYEIRQVDELGRVAIPKSIRNEMGIIEGEPLVINNVGSDFVIFTKYDPNALNNREAPSEILKQAISEMALYAAESEYETEFYEIMDEVLKLANECKEIEDKTER